jgi:hypothetical protein
VIALKIVNVKFYVNLNKLELIMTLKMRWGHPACLFLIIMPIK